MNRCKLKVAGRKEPCGEGYLLRTSDLIMFDSPGAWGINDSTFVNAPGLGSDGGRAIAGPTA
jgi:hypothetical protein